mmetsp:Transcript_24643/g.53770  ORF Transcript_24643/g.53770 Transcript_24643/m.53770 type:complete len:393 (+) Transcript_24643:102-1280(+)
MSAPTRRPQLDASGHRIVVAPPRCSLHHGSAAPRPVTRPAYHSVDRVSNSNSNTPRASPQVRRPCSRVRNKREAVRREREVCVHSGSRSNMRSRFLLGAYVKRRGAGCQLACRWSTCVVFSPGRCRCGRFAGGGLAANIRTERIRLHPAGPCLHSAPPVSPVAHRHGASSLEGFEQLLLQHHVVRLVHLLLAPTEVLVRRLRFAGGVPPVTVHVHVTTQVEKGVERQVPAGRRHRQRLGHEARALGHAAEAHEEACGPPHEALLGAHRALRAALLAPPQLRAPQGGVPRSHQRPPPYLRHELRPAAARGTVALGVAEGPVKVEPPVGHATPDVRAAPPSAGRAVHTHHHRVAVDGRPEFGVEERAAVPHYRAWGVHGLPLGEPLLPHRPGGA